jgi:dipeptidase E
VRGLLPALRSYVAGGGVLIGMSAGAILMTPDIGSAAICGDTPYAPLSDSAGLGLVDFAILPHFDGSDAQRAALAQLGKQVGGVAYGVPDGSGIMVNESRVELIGPVTLG